MCRCSAGIRWDIKRNRRRKNSDRKTGAFRIHLEVETTKSALPDLATAQPIKKKLISVTSFDFDVTTVTFRTG